jgi:hypothetical protein
MLEDDVAMADAAMQEILTRRCASYSLTTTKSKPSS